MLDLDAPVSENNEPRKRSRDEHRERDYYNERSERGERALPEIDSMYEHEAPPEEGLYGVHEKRTRRGRPPSGLRENGDYHRDDYENGRPPNEGRRKPPPSLRSRNGKKKKAKPRRKSLLPNIKINPLYVSIASWSAVAIATIVVVVWFISGLFVDNAFAVYLDGQLVGHIQMTEGLTSEDFHNQAVITLSQNLGGARVNVTQRVTIEEARVSNNERDTQNYILQVLSRRFTYTLAAIGIHVNGTCEGITLRTQAELDQLKLMLQEIWFNENTVEAQFVEPWLEVTVYVDPNTADFWTPQEAYNRLSRTEMQMYPYVIQRGDSLGRIASRFDTQESHLWLDNNLTSDVIHPYTTLYVRMARPLLSVRTFDERSIYEDFNAVPEERENPDMALATTRIIQQGSPGRQRVVERITRENGVERERETLDAEIILEAIPDIIYVGTGASARDVR